MGIFSSLDVAEQPRQLSNPDGPTGLAVAEWLNGNNRESVARAISLLELTAGCAVLEIGFANGRAAPDVVSRAPDVRYSGIDISPTMVDEATRLNEALISDG